MAHPIKRQPSLIQGVAVGFLAYALFAMGDACIKALGRHLPFFEVTFLIVAAQAATMVWAREKGERWRDVFRMNNPRLVLIRTASTVGAMLCAFYAFTVVPLAEAYSLIFLMPAFATLFSIPISGERVGWRRWTAVAVGFLGVLVVVRPGFRDLQLGHLSAAFAAAFGGAGLAYLRVIGQSEKRTSILGTLYVVLLAVSGVLMVPSFTWPEPLDWGITLLGGLVGGVAQIAIVFAARHAPSSRIAPTQYSQIVWAVILGALFFAEYPDPFVYVGMVLVVASGIFTFLREEKLHGRSSIDHGLLRGDE